MTVHLRPELGSAPVRVATRGSTLALRQAQWVAAEIQRQGRRPVELVTIQTLGDAHPTRPVAELGGAGVFTKEIETAVLDHRADVAVHSYKDLPPGTRPGLTVAAVPPRGPVEDLLLVRSQARDLGQPVWLVRSGARVGTGSARRVAQLRLHRPDLSFADLRGNVPTRIERLRSGAFDAVVLAKAGLVRLGLDLADLHLVDLLADGILPAAGQGALAIQCRADDSSLIDLLSRLNDAGSERCVAAERALLAYTGGDCSTALGCLAVLKDGRISLSACWIRGERDVRRCHVLDDDPQSAAQAAFRKLTA